jgi:hypothetical protein
LKELWYEPHLLLYQLGQMTFWSAKGHTIWLCNSNFLEGADEIFPARLNTAYSSVNFNKTCSVIKEVIYTFQHYDGSWLPYCWYCSIFGNKNRFSLLSHDKPKFDIRRSTKNQRFLYSNFKSFWWVFEIRPIFKDLILITAVGRLNKEDSGLYLLVVG